MHGWYPTIDLHTHDKIETESMADRATKAALDAENEFKKFLDDLNQYEYMKVYDDEQQVRFIHFFANDSVLFTFQKSAKFLFILARCRQ